MLLHLSIAILDQNGSEHFPKHTEEQDRAADFTIHSDSIYDQLAVLVVNWDLSFYLNLLSYKPI